MKQLVVWNGGAGKAAQIELLRCELKAHPAQWVELARDVEITSVVSQFVAQGGKTIIAAGGDGTVHAVVNAIMQLGDAAQRPELAIIPLGTANDFAGTLHIPEQVEEAVQSFLMGTAVPIDVVQICGDGLDRFYSNVAAGGNCVRVSEEITDEIKSRWGAFCYVRGAVGVLADMQSYRITMEIDGESLEPMDSWAVLIANGKTNAGRIEVAPQALPNDGLFDVIIIRDGDVMDMVEIVSRNLLGNFLESEQILFRKAKHLRLQSDPPMRFTLDGELVDREPIEFKVIPGAIKMFVGPEFHAPVQQ